jgi:hypothetical protein
MANETRVITVNQGTAAQWENQVRPLEPGEFGYATNTKELKVGDGARSYAQLPAYYNKDMGHLLPAGNLGHGQGAMWNETQQKWVPRPSLGGYDYYVSPAGEDHPRAGYDAAHPVRTITYALNRAGTVLSHPARIKLADGVYPETPRRFLQSYTLTGNTDNPAAVVLSAPANESSACVVSQASAVIEGVTFRPAFTVEQGAVIWAVTNSALYLGSAVIDTTALPAVSHSAVVSDALSRVVLRNVSVRGGADNVLYAHGGRLYVHGLVCQGNMTIASAFACAVFNGSIAFFESAVVATGTLSGGKRYIAGANGDITPVTSIPVSNLEPGITLLGGRAN